MKDQEDLNDKVIENFDEVIQTLRALNERIKRLENQVANLFLLVGNK